MPPVYNTKPTKVPFWALTTANISEPSSGEKDDGWVLNSTPPSSYDNWLKKTSSEWLDWINNRFFDGSDAEHMIIGTPIAVDASNTSGTEEIAGEFAGFGTKGVGALGTGGSGGWDISVRSVEEIGVVGITESFSGKGPTSRTGVLGLGEAGVLGIDADGDVDGASFGDIGVAGISGAYASNVVSVGVFGYGPQGLRGEGHVGEASAGVGVQGVGGENSAGTGGAGGRVFGSAGSGTGDAGEGLEATGGDAGGSGDGGIGIVGKGGDSSSGTDAVGGDFEGGTNRSPIRLAPKTSAPSNSVEGDIYYNSTTKHIYFYDGSSFTQLAEV